MSLSVCFRKFPKLTRVCVCVRERDRKRGGVCFAGEGGGSGGYIHFFFGDN